MECFEVIKVEPLEEVEEKVNLEELEGGKKSAKESVEERRREKAEYARRRRLENKLTPEELEAKRKKDRERRRQWREEMGEEEKAALRRKNAEQARMRRAALPPQKREELRRRHAAAERERLRLQLYGELEGGGDDGEGRDRKKTKAERERLRIANLPPEKLEELRRKRRERMKQRREREKEGLEGAALERWEEKRKKKNFAGFVRRATMTEEQKMARYLYQQAYYSKKGRWKDRSEEEKEKKRQIWREWRKNLTGERKERYLESLKKAQRKYQSSSPGFKNYAQAYYSKVKAEDPERWKIIHERHLEVMRNKYATEAPEQRMRRRHKEKVNAARRRLRKQLEGEGVDKEEIGRRDEELKVKLWREFDPDGEIPSGRPGRRPKTDEERKNEPPPSQVRESMEWSTYSPPPSPMGDPPSIPQSPEEGFPSPPQSPEIPDSPFPDLPPEIFQCPHCTSAAFPEENLLRGHISSIHVEKCWKCPKCREVMLSPQELATHYNSSHKQVQRQQQPQNNQEDNHKIFNYFCMRCPPPSSSPFHPPGFKSRQELMDHVKVNHSRNYWPCHKCQLLKYSKEALNLHKKLCQK